MKIMTRISENNIVELKSNQIFVFGSNLEGLHKGGAAKLALNKFGAIMYNGIGIQGQSYAIPTMFKYSKNLKSYINDFIIFAKENKQYEFLVTEIGTGIAGFNHDEIAPMFKDALNLENVYLPEKFISY